jgi:hypothetical protein
MGEQSTSPDGHFISAAVRAWVAGTGEIGPCSWCEQPLDSGAVPLILKNGDVDPSEGLIAMCVSCQERLMPAKVALNRHIALTMRANVLADLADLGRLEEYGFPPDCEDALQSIGASAEMLEQSAIASGIDGLPTLASTLEAEMLDQAAIASGIDTALAPASSPVARLTPRVGRNDPCPCGSGRKFKRCCGAQ